MTTVLETDVSFDLQTLCIPRVFPNIPEQRIYQIFTDLNIGEIKKIDIISRTCKNGERFNRAFIHFTKWYMNENAIQARTRLLEGKDIKIIYDNPWYWKVSAYVSPNIANKERIKNPNTNTNTNPNPNTNTRIKNTNENENEKNNIGF